MPTELYRLTINIDHDLADAMKREAGEAGVSLASYVADLLEDHHRNHVTPSAGKPCRHPVERCGVMDVGSRRFTVTCGRCGTVATGSTGKLPTWAKLVVERWRSGKRRAG